MEKKEFEDAVEEAFASWGRPIDATSKHLVLAWHKALRNESVADFKAAVVELEQDGNRPGRMLPTVPEMIAAVKKVKARRPTKPAIAAVKRPARAELVQNIVDLEQAIANHTGEPKWRCALERTRDQLVANLARIDRGEQPDHFRVMDAIDNGEVLPFEARV